MLDHIALGHEEQVARLRYGTRFGNGEALRFSAQRDPARDHIGIEVHAPGVGRLLNALADDEECGSGVILLQNIQNAIGILVAGAIVKRQCNDFLLGIDCKVCHGCVNVPVSGWVRI